MSKKPRSKKDFSKGEGLQPLEPVDISGIDDFDQALAAMEKTSFGGRQLGEAASILTEMFTDPEDLTVLTLSGAMTVAKQGLLICELLERKYVDIVVSTGALITHGLIEGIDKNHYKVPDMPDDQLLSKGMCRVYDTIELETSFERLQNLIGEYVDRLFSPDNGTTIGSAVFLRNLGELVAEQFPDSRSIVSAACKSDIPIYVPAFTDSELSLELMIKTFKNNRKFSDAPFTETVIPEFNPFNDLFDFASRVHRHKGKMSIFTIGGGVPRNWAQQISPLFDIMNLDGMPVDPKQYSRGVRICPEPDHWGGLSGCSYEEGVSWAKFLPVSEGGKYAEVKVDATAVLPFLIKGIVQRIEKSKKP
ncbi:MAG: deoxyhypusine synthase family protein [candidate division Zixibacteria bacterium]